MMVEGVDRHDFAPGPRDQIEFERGVVRRGYEDGIPRVREAHAQILQDGVASRSQNDVVRVEFPRFQMWMRGLHEEVVQEVRHGLADAGHAVRWLVVDHVPFERAHGPGTLVGWPRDVAGCQHAQHIAKPHILLSDRGDPTRHGRLPDPPQSLHGQFRQLILRHAQLQRSVGGGGRVLDDGACVDQVGWQEVHGRPGPGGGQLALVVDVSAIATDGESTTTSHQLRTLPVRGGGRCDGRHGRRRQRCGVVRRIVTMFAQ
mmetsp:Transcript_8778/g.21286  ORF Transcript_8778/g.21286 Transcript_8778/m.21286 type:complete len:259 (-) Transcript_8778:494-1270(-)